MSTQLKKIIAHWALRQATAAEVRKSYDRKRIK